MKKREFKRNLAALFALAVAASSLTVPFAVSAETEEEETKIRGYQVLGETSFDHKVLPWALYRNYPARQDFELTDNGEIHITILKASGRDGEHWDLEFSHDNNITLYAGHTYYVKFKAKASRDGLQVTPRIDNIKGDEVYSAFDGEKMSAGYALGGEWGKPVELTTEYQTFTGEFQMGNKDIVGAEFRFTYAHGTEYEGNAEDGDEIWFDEISLIDDPGPGCVLPIDWDPYGYTSRSSFYSGMKNNFISVNQVGYFPRRRKVAVLSDNAGDLVNKAEKIELKEATEFEVINVQTGETVFTGTSSAPEKDADSADTICKLDFSEVTDPGIYYIKAGEYRSAEFKISGDIYSGENDLLTNAMNYFYQNRSGVDILDKYVISEEDKLAHKGSHINDTAAVQKVWKRYETETEAKETYRSSDITADGGWYESSTHAKNMIEGGSAVWALQNMYERSVVLSGSNKFEDESGAVIVPEAGNKVPDVLDEAAFELDWMAQMKVGEDEPFWGEKAGGLYYHQICDNISTGIGITPWDYEEVWNTVRTTKPPTFAATLNYAACAAQAARLWAPYDHVKSEKYMESAVEAYRAYQKYYYEPDFSEVTHPELNTPCPAEEIREDSLYAPIWQNSTGRLYGDTDVSDEAYAAACEIFVSAKELDKDYADEFLKELESFKYYAYKVASRTDNRDAGSSLAALICTRRISAGTLTLALHKDLLSEDKIKVMDFSLIDVADIYLDLEKQQGYGIPYKYDGPGYIDPENLDPDILAWGYQRDSNGSVLNNAIIMAYAYDLTGDGKYMDGVTGAMDYLLGTNPLSFSYITGYGTYCVKNPCHRYWANGIASWTPSAPDGVIVSGPHSMVSDNYLKLMGFKPGHSDNTSQRTYADNALAGSVNDTSVSLNASLAWVASFLQDENDYHIDYVIPGDVDCNGIIDVTDLSTLAISLVENEPLTGFAAKNADVTHNGKVDLADLATLRQYLSKKIDKFE